ncbi:MAG: chalcone isomerase [bacterium]|nr:chalcone isomerase [bacterium]
MSLLPVSAKKIGGINMPATLSAGGENLVLNGTGIREKFFMDIYVAGLYLKKKENNAQKIINANETMAIRLHIVSGIVSGDKMAEATHEGFQKSTKGNTAPIKKKITRFVSVFKSGIDKYDIYDLIYIPGEGVKVYKNKKFKLRTPGLDLKKALFGIWLCRRKDLKDLRKGLLGL